MRSFRKGLIFLLVDVAIIIGIFVLQFRTDSSILEKFGKLQLSLESAEALDSQNAEENITTLNNKLQVTYNGLNFHSDDQNCARITFNNSEEKEIKLTNWEKTSELSFSLFFTEGVSLNFSLSDNNENAGLYVIADMPSNAASILLPFNYNYSMKILSQENGKFVLSDKKNTWDLALPELNDGFIKFTPNGSIAHYSVHNNTKKFSFEDLSEVAMADSSAFKAVLNDFYNNLITTVKASITDPNISEQAVVSYIAAMAQNGKFQQAIDDIPQNFKRSNQRTYLSAPYLNNLVNMNTSLETTVKEKSNLISKASYSESPDIFTERNIAAFLMIYKDTATAKKIIENASNYVIENLTIAQISGLLRTYCDLCLLQPDFAAILKPCLETYIERITDACTFENDVLVISENGNFLSVIQAAETGAAILRYGLISDNETLIKAGRVIISSYLAESSSFDSRTLSALYPILAYDNTFYPHFEIIQKKDNESIWAWTCAKTIKYKKENANSTEFTIDFPEGSTHYVILKGIKKFDTIYLYNMAFRTDPRFETYNSSGYVYQKDTETLLLKSRHKSGTERVRIEVTPERTSNKKTEVTPKTDTKAEIKTEKTEEKTEEKTDSAAASVTTSATTAQTEAPKETSASEDGTQKNAETENKPAQTQASTQQTPQKAPNSQNHPPPGWHPQQSQQHP